MRSLPNLAVLFDLFWFARNLLLSRSALAAENLFLRKQLAFFVEREHKPRRTNNATRFTMANLSRLFDWKNALVVVKPETLIRRSLPSRMSFWRPGQQLMAEAPKKDFRFSP